VSSAAMAMTERSDELLIMMSRCCCRC